MGISINAYNVTGNSAFLSASWSGYFPDQFTGYAAVIECNGIQVAGIQYSSSTSVSGTISGLYPGVTYTAIINLWHKNGIATASTNFTTDAPAPIIPGIPTITSTSSNGYDGIIYFNKGINTSYIIMEFSNSDSTYVTMDQFSGSPAHHTFPNLGVTYYVRSYGVSSDGNISEWSGYWTVKTGTNRPPNWEWITNIYAGASMSTAMLGNNMYSAYVVTAYEWNMFTSKINAFLTYKQLSSGSFTTVTRDTNFTAVILSQAVSNINRMLSSNTISYGTNITAKIFLDMRDRLNSIN